MKRAQLCVSSIGEDCCESARDFGVGIELAQFCTAARLDGAPPEPWECPLDRCLAAADRITGSNDEDGVAAELERILAEF